MSARSGLRAWGAAGNVKIMRDRVARRPLAAAALALATVLGPRDVPAAEDSGRIVQYEKDALTVHLAKAPLGWVVEELGRQTGAEFRGDLQKEREVSADFEEVPLPEALHRLLGDQNFALVYGGGGRLREVKLLGTPQAAAAAPQPPPGQPAAAAPPPVSPAALLGILDRHAPVPVNDRLSQAVGSDTATMRQLMDLGLHHEDAAVRSEAVRTFVQTFESDPAMRASVASGVGGMDDATLANLMRGVAGDRAEELMMQFLTQSRATDVRVRASAILQKLRANR
jgi:hypothetical protein